MSGLGEEVHICKSKQHPVNVTVVLCALWSYILCDVNQTGNVLYVQAESLSRGPKLLSMYTVEQRGFLVRKYWQTGSFKACQTALRTEFGERRAPSKCCIQKLVKK